jgi:hypothetical protein
VDEDHYFERTDGADAVDGDGGQLLLDRGVDDDQVVKVVLIVRYPNRQVVAEQIHTLELAVEFTVLGIQQEFQHGSIFYFLLLIQNQRRPSLLSGSAPVSQEAVQKGLAALFGSILEEILVWST